MTTTTTYAAFAAEKAADFAALHKEAQSAVNQLKNAIGRGGRNPIQLASSVGMAFNLVKPMAARKQAFAAFAAFIEKYNISNAATLAALNVYADTQLMTDRLTQLMQQQEYEEKARQAIEALAA